MKQTPPSASASAAIATPARADRITVDIPVTITSVLSSPIEAAIANLTEAGALIVGATLPRGSPVQIEYHGQITYGTVMWAEQDRFGARFPLGLGDGPLHERLEQARAERGAIGPAAGGFVLPSSFSRAAHRLSGFGRRGID